VKSRKLAIMLTIQQTVIANHQIIFQIHTCTITITICHPFAH
jgi:hypothetical protein